MPAKFIFAGINGNLQQQNKLCGHKSSFQGHQLYIKDASY